MLLFFFHRERGGRHSTLWNGRGTKRIDLARPLSPEEGVKGLRGLIYTGPLPVYRLGNPRILSDGAVWVRIYAAN